MTRNQFPDLSPPIRAILVSRPQHLLVRCGHAQYFLSARNSSIARLLFCSLCVHCGCQASQAMWWGEPKCSRMRWRSCCLVLSCALHVMFRAMRVFGSCLLFARMAMVGYINLSRPPTLLAIPGGVTSSMVLCAEVSYLCARRLYPS